MQPTPDILAQAKSLLKAVQPQAVERLLQDCAPDSVPAAEACLYRAIAAQLEGRSEDALGLASAVVASGFATVPVLVAAGDLQSDLDAVALSEQTYRVALREAPTAPVVHQRLGLVLMDQLRYVEAASAFEDAVRLGAREPRSLNNLGLAQLRCKNYEAALKSLRAALLLAPDYGLAHANLGKALFEKGDMAAAQPHLQRALDLGSNAAESACILAVIARRQGDTMGALRRLELAVKLDPDNLVYRHDLAYQYAESGEHDLSRAQFRHILEVQPTGLKAAIGYHLSLPTIYQDAGHLEESRRQFVAGLGALEAMLPRLLESKPEQLIEDIQASNFFLAYQGRDDIALQRRYAAFTGNVLRHCLPQYFTPLEATARRGRVRVGFLCHFFFEHTIGKYFGSWVTDLDPGKFEVYAYSTSDINDATTARIYKAAGVFRDVSKLGFAAIAEQVRKDDLEILVYPELGSRSSNYALASLRLAPVQCMGWGHPVTSGHDSIDWYLSVAGMEPAGAAAHYSEQLLLLPGLGTCYQFPRTRASGKRADYGLPADRRLYLVPQSMFKIHPDNDDLFARVLARDPLATVVFFSANTEIVTNQFLGRFDVALQRHGLRRDDRVVVLPRASRDDYLRINALCDVMLDTLYWSGGNTSLDALASALPIVTLPGEFMRARQTLGMLEVLGGIPELVASDLDDYVMKAVAAGEPARRAALSVQIRDRSHLLFDRAEPIAALEAHLLRLAGR